MVNIHSNAAVQDRDLKRATLDWTPANHYGSTTQHPYGVTPLTHQRLSAPVWQKQSRLHNWEQDRHALPIRRERICCTAQKSHTNPNIRSSSPPPHPGFNPRLWLWSCRPVACLNVVWNPCPVRLRRHWETVPISPQRLETSLPVKSCGNNWGVRWRLGDTWSHETRRRLSGS